MFLENKITMKNTSALFLLIMVISTILFQCNPKGDNDSHNEGKNIDITVAQWGQEKYLIYLPFYIAQEQGFFEDEGLNIKVKYSGGDDQVFATVLKGEAQFGIGDPIFTAISREKGGKGKVVASIVNGVSFWGISKKDIPAITGINDLSGLKIGTFPAPSTIYTLIEKTIQDGGSNLKSTKIIQAGVGAQIGLLEKGLADVVMELEPAASIAESNGYKIIYSASKYYGEFAFTGVTTTDSYIKENPKIVQHFVNAIENALIFTRTNEQKTIQIARNIFPNLDKNVVSNAVRRMINDKTIPLNANVSEEAWKQASSVRFAVGDLKNTINSYGAVDNSFANRAIKQLKTHQK